MNALLFAGVMSLHDVGVREPAHRFHLPAKACYGPRIVKAFGRQDLDSDRLTEPHVHRAIDGSHPTLTELFLEPVIAKHSGRRAGRDVIECRWHIVHRSANESVRDEGIALRADASSPFSNRQRMFWIVSPPQPKLAAFQP